MSIEELLNLNGFEDCEGCPNFICHVEKYPYGETYIVEEVLDCNCDNADDCPRLT